MDIDVLAHQEELVLGAKKVFLYLLSAFTQKTVGYNVANIEFVDSSLMCKEQ